MALGQHPDAVNLGEISALRRFVPGRTYVAPRACGCLQQLDKCPFWSGVARRLGSMERLARAGLPLSPTMGWRRYAPWLAEPSGELARWGKAAADLYRATLPGGNAKVAVDTSKGTTRAWWLWRSGAVDLSIVWLTRRPEDVLRSQIKHGNSTLRTAMALYLAQRQAEQFVRKVEATGVRVLRITYEHLTEQPRAVLSEILEHAGLPWHEAVLTPRPDHVIGGHHAVKHGGRHVIEPATGARPPLPLKARLTLKLLNNLILAPDDLPHELRMTPHWEMSWLHQTLVAWGQVPPDRVASTTVTIRSARSRVHVGCPVWSSTTSTWSRVSARRRMVVTKFLP
jgi:hypothetical protein